ncbi:hypothetical protein [Sulfurimonas sp.]
MQIKDIDNYEDLLDIVYDNEEYIEHGYKSKDEQILIHKELVLKIVDFLKNINLSDIDINKAMEILFRDILELKKSDTVVVKENYIFIKQTVKKVPKVDESELESFYKSSFSGNDVEDLFLDVAELFINEYFTDGHISNHEYERIGFKLIKRLIAQELEKDFLCAKDFYIVFAEYIFNKNLRLIFDLIAETLLKEVAFSNTEVIEFLKYYSQDIIVVGGKRYKVPELTAENGLRWNVVSMLAMVKTYIKVRESIIESEEQIESLNAEIKSLHIDGFSPIAHNAEVLKEYAEIEDDIKENAHQIEIVHDSLKILKTPEDIFETNKELDNLKDIRMELKQEKAATLAEKASARTVANYEKLIKEVETINRDSKAKYRILEQNKSSFDSIKKALIKALVSKKQPA